MAKKNLIKTIILLGVTGVILLPFYFLRSYILLSYRLLVFDYSQIEKSNNVVSILVLGKGGEGHSAPDLTDTIVDVFINPSSGKITTLSIPRDIWIAETRAKINSSYYWDKEKGNQNYELTRYSVEAITGILPNYIVVIDFSIFEGIVNSLSGVKINVDNSFVDEKFPIPGKENDLCGGDTTYSCRYETISFVKGEQIMDGKTTLKFVRSRNAQGDEGTDSARQLRQQKVIKAITEKIVSFEFLSNPQKLYKTAKVLIDKIETEIDFETGVFILKMFVDFNKNIQSLEIGDEFLLISQNLPKYDYQYVFIPAKGNWREFKIWLKEKI